MSHNVTISAIDGAESESNVEQNQLFGPRRQHSCNNLTGCNCKQGIVHSVPQDYDRSPQKTINSFQKSHLIAGAYFTQLEHWIRASFANFLRHSKLYPFVITGDEIFGTFNIY